MIDRELPIGASYSAVIELLNKHHIEHATTLNEDPNAPGDRRNTLTAYIYPNIRILWITGGLTIRFRFTPDRKMKSFTVQEDWTGLP